MIKQTDGKVTRTAVTTLRAADRIDEIARMLGGVDITEQARAHAREMLGTVGSAGAKSPATTGKVATAPSEPTVAPGPRPPVAPKPAASPKAIATPAATPKSGTAPRKKGARAR